MGKYGTQIQRLCSVAQERHLVFRKMEKRNLMSPMPISIMWRYVIGKVTTERCSGKSYSQLMVIGLIETRYLFLVLTKHVLCD